MNKQRQISKKQRQPRAIKKWWPHIILAPVEACVGLSGTMGVLRKPLRLNLGSSSPPRTKDGQSTPKSSPTASKGASPKSSPTAARRPSLKPPSGTRSPQGTLTGGRSPKERSPKGPAPAKQQKPEGASGSQKKTVKLGRRLVEPAKTAVKGNMSAGQAPLDSARSGLDALEDNDVLDGDDIPYLEHMRRQGMTATELRHLGSSAQALRLAGYKTRAMREAGFTAAQLADAGFSQAAISLAGFTQIHWSYGGHEYRCKVENNSNVVIPELGKGGSLDDTSFHGQRVPTLGEFGEGPQISVAQIYGVNAEDVAEHEDASVHGTPYHSSSFHEWMELLGEHKKTRPDQPDESFKRGAWSEKSLNRDRNPVEPHDMDASVHGTAAPMSLEAAGVMAPASKATFFQERVELLGERKRDRAEHPDAHSSLDASGSLRAWSDASFNSVSDRNSGEPNEPSTAVGDAGKPNPGAGVVPTTKGEEDSSMTRMEAALAGYNC